MKLHPETKVVIDVVADNESYIAKLATTLSGDRKNAPDIIHGNFMKNAFSADMNYAVEKGYLYNMAEMLDEENPYNGGLVRDAFEETDLSLILNNSGGKYYPYLPFDKLGFALYYNKDILDAEGITPPTTLDELAAACEKLIAAGYETPLASGRDSGHLVNFIADARYRQREYDFLVQPGDAIWDESTMSANVNFKFDESDLLCDLNTIMSTERLLQYVAKNGIVTEDNIKIFEEFYKIAQYFPSNWYGADSTQAITDFETQTSPLLYQASYNAGLIYSDIKQLPKNQQFEWGTVQLTGFGKTPEGFSETLRGFWDFGNRMSIVYTDDEDHLERIKDFYKFWYSKDGAIMCYEETLNNGNFVQGPCVIKGVELSPELEMLLAGFETAPAKDFSKLLVAGITSADTPLDIDIMTRFTSGKIDAETFLKERTAVSEASLADQIARSGYDLDPTTKDTPAK